MLSHSPSIVTDGLVLCLDAANPRSYGGSGTNWGDLSGNGNNGTLVNGPTFNAASLGSIQLVTDDYITTNFGANRNPYNDPLTISVWVKKFTTTGQQMIISTHQTLGNGNVNQRLYVGAADGYWNWGIQNSPWTFSGISVNTNWNFITICIDSTNARFFLNTELIYTKPVNSSYVLNHELWLGRHDNSYYFSGYINMPMVHNRALSPQEIEQNFKATRGRFGI